MSDPKQEDEQCGKRKAKMIMQSVKEELSAKGVKFQMIELGTMVLDDGSPGKCNCLSCRLGRTIARRLLERN